MNELKINDINSVYEILEKAESVGDEISIALLNNVAIIYHSDILDMFKIDIIDKYDIKPQYYNLSNVTNNDFYDYVRILCDSFRFNYSLDDDF